ncbi:hypothetical protein ACVGV6_02370, partial [Enterobacter sichuanensis]
QQDPIPDARCGLVGWYLFIRECYLGVRLTGGTPEAAAHGGHLTASTFFQFGGAIIRREALHAPHHNPHPKGEW